MYCKGLLFLFPNMVPTDPFEKPTFYQLVEGPVVALGRDDCTLVVNKQQLQKDK
jgi:hypothetical protein